MAKLNYNEEVCTLCGQSITYLLPIDRGTVDILVAVVKCIEKKGMNCVHLTKEVLAQGFFKTPHQSGNITRPRAHGLVAPVKGDHLKGNFCVTDKGLDFLRGEKIPKYAILSKKDKRTLGYFEPETLTVQIDQFRKGDDYWEGVGFEIRAGKVVKDTSEFIKTKEPPIIKL